MKYSSIIYHCFRKLQIQNKFIEVLPATGVSTLETHMLVELQANPNLSVSSLADLMLLNQSTVSRAVSSLIERGLIEEEPNSRDRRRKNIFLTELGEETVKHTDMFANSLLAIWSSRVSKKQIENLIDLLRAIADRLEVPNSNQRTNESAYRVQQRRITRGLGLMSQNVMSSSLSSIEWHTLNYLALCPFPTSTTEIASFFDVPSNTVTTILNKFEKDKLIKRNNSSEDKRRVAVAISRRGKKVCQEIEINFSKDINVILDELDQSDLKHSVEALKLFTDGHLVNTIFPPNPKVIYKELTSKQKNTLRGQIVTWIVAQENQASIPEEILSSRKKCFGAFADDNLLICLQLSGETQEIELVSANESLSNNLQFMICENLLASLKKQSIDLSQISWKAWQALLN